ncbi:hypothetical protein INS49_005573 [Diaporthe citri]|uniref:uncharacterized protein n=1 Tax=Diaporthe citri TaxID=83186 RepID=UPI001C7F3864|nr:uncharacterized protein INS49_005573 [Diaporthe citri]KAG6353611.1 hypothetical protein INS49_005573 [Diaporthe citri]
MLANVLLFSRDGYPAISGATGGFPSIEVDRGANIEDINRFIGDRSKQLTKDLASLKEIQDHLLSSADGMFLWVSLVIDSIKKERTARKMKLAALNMPRGVSGAYAGALKRILVKEEPARGLALKALLWITNSKKPVSKPQLLEVLALEKGMSSMDDDQLERLDPDIPLTTDCADLLVLKDGHYALLHASLGDFLRSLSKAHVEGLDYHGDLQARAPQILAEDCITFLKFGVFGIGPMPSQDALEELFQKHPFLEYAGLFWGDHLREALDSGAEGLREVACGLIRATNTRRLLHQIYIRNLSNMRVHVNPFPFTSDTTPLHLLSIFGLDAPLSAFSPDEVDIRQTDGFAAVNTHMDVMRKLLQHSANASLQAWDGSTALHLVSSDGDVQMAAELLNSGANIEARRDGSLTPLHDAAANGWEKIVTFLLESGAEKEARTYSSQTPLLLAIQEGRTGASRVLLHVGADIDVVDDVGSNCLHSAARRNQAETMSLLLANPLTARLLNTGDRNQQTPLHVATWNGSTVCARMLLEHGADPEIAETLGWTPLSGALRQENLELAHMLVDGYKADPKHVFAEGGTSMHALAFWDRAEHIHTLLSWGIDLLAQDRHGNTALHIAVRRNRISFERAFLAEVSSQDVPQGNGRDKLLGE